jgi:DNA invertase Pin-like site-specific DNA recombinase
VSTSRPPDFKKEITQRCGRLRSGEQALSGGTRQFLLKQDLGPPQAVAQDAACFCQLPDSGTQGAIILVAISIRVLGYTRKSSEEGLDMEFNSLDAQRDACEAYVASQRAEGWVLVSDRYDDGGVSGGTLERPALQRLIHDVQTGLVDVVVVYKIDRLSRSLTDFSKLVEVFEANQVTFVSVTQSFNTTTSMGRLTLNILLSFAQFEREVIGERIRDKLLASRKKGMWMGGTVPFGYRVENRKLLIEETEAATVRMIFGRFIAVGSATVLARQLHAEGVTSRSGMPIDKGWLYKLLNNRVYIGEAVHKRIAYPGEHQPIIRRDLWDNVHSILAESPRKRAGQSRRQTPALLKGLLFAPNGSAMTPSHTRKQGRLYRYYVTMSVLKLGPDTCPIKRVPAAEIENAVVDQLRVLLRSPEMIVKTWMAARGADDGVSETEVREALIEFDGLWDELFPAEQARFVQLLVERVDVDADGVSIRLRTEGIGKIVSGLRQRPELDRAA